jgi:hypothetical protein
MTKFLFIFFVLIAFASPGCANQTTFHTVPLGAKVYVNGALCGSSPCVYHTRYGFPDRIRIELKKEGYQSADFYLDTEPPQISYLLLGFGSYLFHTFSQEYRFQLKPLPAVTSSAASDAASPPTHNSPSQPVPMKPPQNEAPSLPPCPPKEVAPPSNCPTPFWI